MMKRKLAFKIFAIVLSTAFGLFFAEFVLRSLNPVHVVIFPEGLIQPSFDPAICYELNPNWPGHNPDGLRVNESNARNVTHGKKILVIGDSIAYGLGVDNTQTISAIMSRILKERRLKENWEILNFGVPGYGIEQIYAQFKTKGIKYKPDYLAYIYCLNDIFVDAGKTKNFLINNKDRLIISKRLFKSKYIDILFRLQIVQRGVILYRELRYDRKMQGNNHLDLNKLKRETDGAELKIIHDFLYKYDHSHYKNVHWGNIEHSYYPEYYYNLFYLMKLNANLSYFGKICKKIKISPYIFIIPIFTPNDTSDYIFTDIHLLIKALSKQHGLNVRDLQPVLAMYAPSFISQKDCSHPNAYGNEIIAKDILETLGFTQGLASQR